MTATITDLLDRWNNDEGKPYKGILIDVKAYDPDHPNNIGCMCAQGQVLNIIGGWGFDKLNKCAQSDADTEVAKLLSISRAHSILLRQINDSVSGAPSTVLTSPVDVLGDQWSKILDFFVYLDGMDRAAWNASRGAAWNASRGAAGAAAWNPAGAAAWNDARAAAWNAARDAAGAAARDDARDAAGAAARDASRAAAARDTALATNEIQGDAARAAALATNEIQGAETIRAEGKEFFFLPLFGFPTPDYIPARGADYGNGVVPS